MVIERFGKFDKVPYSGLNWVIPFIDQPRTITWRKTQIGVDGRLEDQTVTATRIDLRESTFNFTQQEVYTRDTVLLNVNSLMFHRSVGLACRAAPARRGFQPPPRPPPSAPPPGRPQHLRHQEGDVRGGERALDDVAFSASPR